MAEKSAREPRVYLWDTSRQVGTNLNAILRGRIFVQMLPRPPIVSVIRVKLPKITLHLLFFVSDDLWMFCVSVVLFFVTFFLLFLKKYIFNCFEETFLSTFFCVLVIRVELKGSYLEKP
jgi:hypothetical protein